MAWEWHGRGMLCVNQPLILITSPNAFILLSFHPFHFYSGTFPFTHPSALCHFLFLPLPFTSLTAPILLPTSHHTQLNLLTVQQLQQLPPQHCSIISQNTVMYMAQFINPCFKVKLDLRNTSLYATSELCELNGTHRGLSSSCGCRRAKRPSSFMRCD